ncbi:hypothetical protein ACVWZP_002955 [Pseudomonas sp. TE36184]|jgi:hypothetical protein
MSIALNVITGFLGSGKTSLLTRLLQGESLGDTALLINEFGDVGIDHLLVEEVAFKRVILETTGLADPAPSSRPSTTTCNCAGVFISAWINSGKRPKPCSGASWTPSTRNYSITWNAPCRSELAREKPENAACIQDARVIVDDFREQARSYKGRR